MSAKQIATILITALIVFAVGSLATASDMPEAVSLDSMVKLFEGVEFDHEMHTDLGEDCSACHHHTTGTGTADERCIRCHADSDEVATVGCSGCHVADPFSAAQINQESEDRYQFHIDKPGLKAAYHWNCVGCHEQMDGPVECLDCHERTEEGEAFYHTNVKVSPDAGTDGH